jgi:hypothetical protein
MIASGEAAFLSYVGPKDKPLDALRVHRIRDYPGTLVCAELALADEIESDDAIQAARLAITPITTNDLEGRIQFT